MPIVTITATGLDTAITPNNFTVSIINYTGATTVYATGVTRTSLISGYNVTVEPGDETVKVTSTGLCTSFVDVDVSMLALQSFRPNPVQGTTSFENPESLSINQGDIEYILGDTFIYPFMDPNDFTLTHVSTTGAGGLSATGGPFVPPTLDAIIDPLNDTTLLLIGDTRSSYSTDESTNTSTYRVTYTPSGLSRDFNYYWVTDL